MLLLAVCTVIPICCYLFLKHKERAFSRMKNTRTGQLMPGLSFIRTIYSILVERQRIGLAASVKEEHKRYGYTYRAVFFKPMVTLGQPEDVRLALRKIEEFKKEPVPPILQNLTRKIFGTQSLFHINQPAWHDQRSLLNTAFTNNRFFFEPLQKKASQCINLWNTASTVYIGADLQKMTLDALAMCIFGEDFDTLGGKLTGPLAAYHYVINNLFKPVYLLVPFYLKLPLPGPTVLLQKIKEFDDYCWSIIKRRASEEPTSLVDLMISSGLDPQIIRDNVGLFFIAGHETTASTLMWLVGLIASYPSVQEKLREELLLKAPNELTYDAIKELEYLDWVIRETMRLYPAGPIIAGRCVENDMTIGDWTIPAGTSIQFDLISMLHDPKIWEDPEQFIPERWKKITPEQRASWIPFSYGPRVCIGMNFSLLEQKIFVATLLRKYSHFKLSPDSKLTADPKVMVSLCPDKAKLGIEFTP